MNPRDPIVFIVDDDRPICEALSALLSTFDLHVVTFGSAAEYLAYPKPDAPTCLILDVELPDINGLELQSQTTQENHPQIVFITGHGDIPTSVRAIKAGAVDFLTKPFSEADLMRAVHAAIAQDSQLVGGARDCRKKAVDWRGDGTALSPGGSPPRAAQARLARCPRRSHATARCRAAAKRSADFQM